MQLRHIGEPASTASAAATRGRSGPAAGVPPVMVPGNLGTAVAAGTAIAALAGEAINNL